MVLCNRAQCSQDSNISVASMSTQFSDSKTALGDLTLLVTRLSVGELTNEHEINYQS